LCSFFIVIFLKGGTGIATRVDFFRKASGLSGNITWFRFRPHISFSGNYSFDVTRDLFLLSMNQKATKKTLLTHKNEPKQARFLFHNTENAPLTAHFGRGLGVFGL